MHRILWELVRLGLMERLSQQWGLRDELIAAYSYFKVRYKDDRVNVFSTMEDGDTVTNSHNLWLGRFKLDNRKKIQKGGASSGQIPREQALTILSLTRLGVNNACAQKPAYIFVLHIVLWQ